MDRNDFNLRIATQNYKWMKIRVSQIPRLTAKRSRHTFHAPENLMRNLGNMAAFPLIRRISEGGPLLSGRLGPGLGGR